jgi:hypothetical protein
LSEIIVVTRMWNEKRKKQNESKNFTLRHHVKLQNVFQKFSVNR